MKLISMKHIRNRYFFLADLLLVFVAAAGSFNLRLDAEGMVRYRDTLAIVAVLALLTKPVVFYFFGLYRRYWRYASADDLWTIAIAVTTASIVTTSVEFFLLPMWLSFTSVPRSIPIIDWLLTMALVGGVRFSVRLLARGSGTRRVRPVEVARVLVIGAGDAGAMIVREMHNNPQLRMIPVGFVDDDADKSGMTIHGVRVLGARQDIPALVERESIDEVIIAMPTASGRDIRAIIGICQSVGVRYKTIPGVFELISGDVSVKHIRDVQVEDLLRRDPVETDPTIVAHYVQGARVLVTGAGGSIGSEICRQVASFRPRQLVLLGHGEHSIYQIERELRRKFPSLDLVACIADVRDARRLDQVFRQYRPNVVFHAAAHKHVWLMEANAVEAVTNNVLGTQLTLDAACQHRVDRFVLISTDKAVNPAGVMGASKRLAEMLAQDAARRCPGVFVAVRFGNVLGSRGSVVPLFKEQIAAGGPITVTDPNMARFFMTIPEATNLVLQAGALGQSGEIYMLDMGQPVRIVDLARDMIELSGLRPGEDIEIQFIGARPGEKIREELSMDKEDVLPTTHERIKRVCGALSVESHHLRQATQELVALAYAGDEPRLRERLMHLARLGVELEARIEGEDSVDAARPVPQRGRDALRPPAVA